VDGSSTVYPITEAVAEEFQATAAGQKTRVTIAVSGTGGGFKRLCAGDADLTGASRPIKPAELEACARAHQDYLELPVAYDGIAVVVNPANDWAKTMTVAELKKIWAPDAQGKITRWSQVRPGWPDKPLHLFGPGVDSGTYDYFTKAIVGEEHASRGDYTSSEDDNVLVQGVSRDEGGLGFFGFAYFAENRDKLQIVSISAGGAPPVVPSPETIAAGTYQPLSRPVFLYVRATAAARPEVRAFLDFYLDKGAPLVTEVGYVPLPAEAYELVKARLRAGTKGSVFHGGGSRVGVSVQELLRQERGDGERHP